MNTCSEKRNFEEWWMISGSGIAPEKNDDMEGHAKRVANLAWDAAMLLNCRNPQYEDGMTAEDDKRFNRQWDVGNNNESWECKKCGQTNSCYAKTCGRCEDA